MKKKIDPLRIRDQVEQAELSLVANF